MMKLLTSDLLDHYKAQDKQHDIEMKAKIYKARCDNIPIEVKEKALIKLSDKYLRKE